jgi:citrate lyase beta subunit
MKSIKYGATLYLPALRPDLAEVANGWKIPGLRTAVFCTEDAVAEAEVPAALDNLKKALGRLEEGGPRRFVRPRSPQILARLLNFKGIERVDGFVLPKADLESLPVWFELLAARHRFEIMPILETAAVFDPLKLLRLRDWLTVSPLRPRVTALRVGALDLLNLLGLRRDLSQTIYQSPVGPVLDHLAGVFRPAGFELAAPGFEGLDDARLLAEEAALDVRRGLFAKTAVHPWQISVIEEAYRVTPEELEMAQAVTDPERPAVFRLGGRMCEKAVHAAWAATALERVRHFGLKALRPEGVGREAAVALA